MHVPDLLVAMPMNHYLQKYHQLPAQNSHLFYDRLLQIQLTQLVSQGIYTIADLFTYKLIYAKFIHCQNFNIMAIGKPRTKQGCTDEDDKSARRYCKVAQ